MRVELLAINKVTRMRLRSRGINAFAVTLWEARRLLLLIARLPALGMPMRLVVVPITWICTTRQAQRPTMVSPATSVVSLMTLVSVQLLTSVITWTSTSASDGAMPEVPLMLALESVVALRCNASVDRLHPVLSPLFLHVLPPVQRILVSLVAQLRRLVFINYRRHPLLLENSQSPATRQDMRAATTKAVHVCFPLTHSH